MSQPRANNALEEYFRWESQSWVEVIADLNTDEKVHFMPLEITRSYFTSDNSKKLNKILVQVFQTAFPPIDAELVLRDHTAIFCILLSIDQGKFIEHFAQYEELSDRRLPFDPNRPPEDFPEIDNDPTFLQRFCEIQRMYCVPAFDGHMLHKRFGSQRLLPITHKEPYGTEGTAARYIINIYGPHNKMLQAGHDTTKPTANTFILKNYQSKEAGDDYTQEVNGFRAVKQADSILRFYGSYIHGTGSNLLLEFADKGSLEEYFERESPPNRGVDIIKFWENLFRLIKGLKAIHSVREGHHNVSTETVVVLSNGVETPSEWQFKLANFGTDRSKQDPSEMSQTYDAPECGSAFDPNDPSKRASLKITASADIWSLGCIYSEAAMWIADGYRGLLNYRKQRSDETTKKLSHGGDCFHDGEQVLNSVLDAHRDIEDRLRRSDVITKEVLETMVDEMLWEEDRPNAKALLRKSEMVLARARQKMAPTTPEESFPRPPSRQSRQIALPRFPPPAQPLPPLPRIPSGGLAAIHEQHQPAPNVEKWRLQVTAPKEPEPLVTGTRSDFSRTAASASDLSSPTLSTTQPSTTEDLDREIAGSVASWRGDDDTSTVASPYTPMTSPHTSLNFDRSAIPNEGRARTLRSMPSYEYKPPPTAPSHGLAYIQQPTPSNTPPPQPPQPPPRSPERFSTYVTKNLGLGSATYGPPPLVDPRVVEREQKERDLIQQREASLTKTETQSIGRASSGVGAGSHSRRSSVYSTPTIHSPTAARAPSVRSQEPPPSEQKKKRLGFSLFPTRVSSRRSSSPSRYFAPSLASSDSTGSTPLPATYTGKDFEYLSLNTCYEWKRAHKKTKKHAQIPGLPGSTMLKDLEKRDHVFIIDDSSSMASCWADVKRVFECLSYIVKGMSKDGTELFFTTSYDTWRRKDTYDLVQYLDKHITKGETNISYRLNLQMEFYRIKLADALARKKVKDIRPISYYVLTNGEWGKGADPKIALSTMAGFLKKEGLAEEGMVSVEFISFATSAKAGMKIKELCGSDFGMDLVDSTRWTGNVLKMLRGPLDKSLFESSDGGENSPVVRPVGVGKEGLEGAGLTELA